MSQETITTDISDDAKALYQEIKELGGAEISKPYWCDAQELVDVGLITLGAARGPGNAWKRGRLKDETD